MGMHDMHGRRYKEREKKGKWESGFSFLPPPLSSLRLESVSVVIPAGYPPPPIYCVVQLADHFFRDNKLYLFKFNLCDGKKLAAFN